MKLNDVRPTIETSGELEEQFFSIEDQGMIFDILRNKMYSNPILAICREITCNARDAHREVGTPERPIHIHLPSRLEPFYKIKDFGPGISPDRMVNIFIKYTASTKRKDNVQTGGFGLGAKTPFSYSDTFTILTNFNGVQYNYACFIDETKVGKLALLSEAPTTEQNGTEIIIPVKPVDFRHFAEWTEHATRHWDVKPVIKGDAITFKEINKVIEGNGWAIVTNSNWNREAKLIIDGIEYPLDLNALKTYADSKIVNIAKGDIHLYFNVGELSLSASREQVYLDKETQKKICERLDLMTTEIKQNIHNKIQDFPNLWVASCYYREELSTLFNNSNFLGAFFWRGIPLTDMRTDLGCQVFTFTKGKYSRKYGTDPNKLSRSNSGQYLTFSTGSALFINDLPLKEPTPRHVKKAFDDDATLKSVQVIIPNDEVKEADLDKKIHLDLMKPRRLSEITKASARAYTPATSRLIISKFEKESCAFRQTSYASLDDDTNEKVLCMLSKDSYPSYPKRVHLKSGECFSSDYFNILCKKFPNHSFYGVDSSTPADRIEEEFSDFQDLEEFLAEKVISDSSINYLEIKLAIKHSHETDERQLRSIKQYSSLIQDPNSLFLKRLHLHDKIKELAGQGNGLLSVYECVKGRISETSLEDFAKKNPDLDIEKTNEEYLKKYPLLEHISTYYHNYDRIVEPVAQYINLVDKS